MSALFSNFEGLKAFPMVNRRGNLPGKVATHGPKEEKRVFVMGAMGGKSFCKGARMAGSAGLAAVIAARLTDMSSGGSVANGLILLGLVGSDAVSDAAVGLSQSSSEVAGRGGSAKFRKCGNAMGHGERRFLWNVRAAPTVVNF